jgi:hypothetical protein
LIGAAASAATVTRKVYIEFDGDLAGGNAYALGPGELDVTGSFRRNGAATISGGVADIPGDVNAASGFLFDSALLDAPLSETSWVIETILVPDVPAAEQPSNPQPFNHFLDVQGDLFFRFNGNGMPAKITQFGYWDGSTEPTITTPDLPTNRFSHVALTWNAGTNTLEGFIDGASMGATSTGSPFATPSTNVGFGFFSRTGFLNRAIDGKLASAAFSTFTGAFNPGFGPGFDFQLNPAEAPLLALNLTVNTVSGRISIANNTLAPVALNGYQVASPLGSLDVSAAGWLSLADQNLDPVLGGDEPGETWEKGGNPSRYEFVEGFLLGNTLLEPGESLSLGRAYDIDLDARDLAFDYRVAGQSGVVSAVVHYDTARPQIVGDYDDDFDVDGGDFLAWQRALGGEGALPNDITPDSVTADDLAAWKSNFGASAAGAASQLAAAAAPEPRAVAMSACWAVAWLHAPGTTSLLRRRRRPWRASSGGTCIHGVLR